MQAEKNALIVISAFAREEWETICIDNRPEKVISSCYFK